MLESLTGKVCWITGAGTGIGQAAAIALARDGAHVILSGRSIQSLHKTAELVAAVEKAAPNYMPLARQANASALLYYPGTGIPLGPYADVEKKN